MYMDYMEDFNRFIANIDIKDYTERLSALGVEEAEFDMLPDETLTSLGVRGIKVIYDLYIDMLRIKTIYVATSFLEHIFCRCYNICVVEEDIDMTQTIAKFILEHNNIYLKKDITRFEDGFDSLCVHILNSRFSKRVGEDIDIFRMYEVNIKKLHNLDLKSYRIHTNFDFMTSVKKNKQYENKWLRLLGKMSVLNAKSYIFQLDVTFDSQVYETVDNMLELLARLDKVLTYQLHVIIKGAKGNVSDYKIDSVSNTSNYEHIDLILR